MKKSIFLFFAAILCAMSVQGAASKQFNDQQFLYCIVENTNWNSWGIKYNWYWDSGEWYKEEDGTKISENHWYAKVPNAYIGGVQFIRCSQDLASKWDWSVTKNSDSRSDNKINCAKITGNNWGNADISWTTYAPPMSSVTLADNGTTVNSGTGTQADPYIIEIGTKIKVQASGTKAVDDPDAVINYAFKYGATSQDSETTTWEIDANSPSTTYAIELEGYTKVNTTSSEKKAATKLYYQTVADATLPTYQVTVTANDPAMGTVTGAGEYSEGATAELTATPNAGYRFVNWTDGGTEKSTNATYSFTVTENVALVANFQAIPEETVYFINTDEWARVNIHKWGGTAADSNWPGEQLTASGEKIGVYDIYSYTAKQGDYAKIIFNSKTSDTDSGNDQTADLDWTAGKYYIHNYNGNKGWYTQEEAEALLVAPVVYEKVYFVNNKNWSLVQIHAWNGSDNNGWPGQALTATGEIVAGFDVYSFEAAKGTYTNLLFNNIEGENSVQTSDFVWTADKYYYMDAAANYAGGTAEEVAVLVAPDPLATEVYLAGEMTNWGDGKIEFKKATIDATTASVKVNLSAKSYTFQLVIDGIWYGNKSTMQRGGDAVHEGGWSFEDTSYGANCTIVADIAGDYTFTWDLTTKKLTVAYPPLPKYTVTATAENGSVTGAGEYEQGSEATLVATPDAGYAFKNWTKEGEEVSTEATYTFTVTANVELVANFVPEETHEVTVSYLCNATPIPGQTTQTLAVGVTTPSTISAPAITNYKFDSWTLGTGVQSEDDSKNPIQITTLASGEYTLAANYTKIELTYTVEVPAGTEKCFIRGAFDGWDKFHEMELKDGETNIFTLTIDGAVTTDEYKYACQADWAYAEVIDGGGNRTTWTELDQVEQWAEPAKCYLMGIGGDWTTGIEMEEDGEQFKLLCQPIAEGEQFKFKYGDTWSDGVENHDFPGIKWVDDDEDGNSNITLPAGNYNFYYKKATNQVYIEAATDCGPATITLTTGNNDDVIEANIGKTVNVVIERSFTANDGFYTLCVPFNMPASVIGKAYSLGTITKHVTGESIDIELVEVSELLVGMPYLVLPKANMSELVVENVTIQSDPASGQNVTNEERTVNIFFEGFYSAPGRTTNGTTEYYVGNNGYLYKGEVEIPGLSGLFTITDWEGNPLNVRARVVTREEVETGFENITNGENTTIKLIENGQLIIIRGGKKFNAQGQKL